MGASVTVKTYVRNKMVRDHVFKMNDVVMYDDVPYRMTKRATFAYAKGLDFVKKLPQNTGDILGVYVYDQAGRLLAAWRQMENYGGRMTGTMQDPFGNGITYKA